MGWKSKLIHALQTGRKKGRGTAPCLTSLVSDDDWKCLSPRVQLSGRCMFMGHRRLMEERRKRERWGRTGWNCNLGDDWHTHGQPVLLIFIGRSAGERQEPWEAVPLHPKAGSSMEWWISGQPLGWSSTDWNDRSNEPQHVFHETCYSDGDALQYNEAALL